MYRSQHQQQQHQYAVDSADLYNRQLNNRPISPSSWDNELNDATYELDHLATYTVSPHRGLAYPTDAISRLRRMVVTSGVWTRRLRLRVGSRDLVLVEGLEAVERFPLRHVGTVAFSASCDSFDNVVAFTVAGDSLLKRPAEIHVFQCVGCQGQDLVNDIEAAKANRPLPSKLGVDVSITPALLPIYPRPQIQRPQPAAQTSQSSDTSLSHSDSSESTSNVARMSPEERARIDIKALNLCFDEIEQFVAMLQQAAQDVQVASEPESERVKAPLAKHFYNIFQKFKLSFILLARLKHNLRDPNASELVIVLFDPLSVVIDASRAGSDNQPHLGSQVVSPLLTTAAVDLLNNCLPSKQTEIWRSLGRAWNTPRNKWNDRVPTLLLKFSNDRSPPQAWIDEIAEGLDVGERTSSAYSGTHSGQQSQGNEATNSLNRAGMTARLDDSRDVRKSDQQSNYLRELEVRGARICTVVKRRDANDRRELTVEVNEVMELLDDKKNWWSVRNSDGKQGFIPKNIVHRHNV